MNTTPDTPAAAPIEQPDPDRLFIIPITLPDGRIAMMRKCDLRDDDLVTFCDSSTLTPAEQAAEPAPSEVVCDNCGGSGEVKAMSYGHGPYDYEYDASCGKCDGTGIPPTLAEAARAVIERWDTPNWKDAPATAIFISRLRNALSASPAQGVSVQEPVAVVHSKFGDPEAFGEREIVVLTDLRKIPYNTKLYATPPEHSTEARDAARLMWVSLAMDGSGDHDFHADAAEHAALRGAKTTEDADYLHAVRIAIDAAMSAPPQEPTA